MLRFHFLDAVRVAYPGGFKPKEEESDSDSDSDSDLEFESDSDSEEDGNENKDNLKGKNKENERPETPPPPAAGDDPDSTTEATVPSEPNHSEIVVETPKKHWKREFVSPVARRNCVRCSRNNRSSSTRRKSRNQPIPNRGLATVKSSRDWRADGLHSIPPL